MKPVVAGAAAAAAIVIAFLVGSMIEIESDGDIELSVESEGPLEQAGEKIDEAIEQTQ